MPVIEGYGLTETAPILTVNPPDAPRIGTVGKAIPGVELRIADDGEILARGPNVMSGYYNKPEATAEVLRDGWFHTGDIGTLDARRLSDDHGSQEGPARHLGRQEDRAAADRVRAQAQPARGGSDRARRPPQVRHRADRSRLRRARAPPERSGPSARPSSVSGGPRAWSRAAERDSLVGRDDVVALYQEIIDALNRELSQFERIKKIGLLPREFSMDSGELTPTLKVKRKVVEENWRQLIEEMYGTGKDDR